MALLVYLHFLEAARSPLRCTQEGYDKLYAAISRLVMHDIVSIRDRYDVVMAQKTICKDINQSTYEKGVPYVQNRENRIK